MLARAIQRATTRVLYTLSYSTSLLGGFDFSISKEEAANFVIAAEKSTRLLPWLSVLTAEQLIASGNVKPMMVPLWGINAQVTDITLYAELTKTDYRTSSGVISGPKGVSFIRQNVPTVSSLLHTEKLPDQHFSNEVPTLYAGSSLPSVQVERAIGQVSPSDAMPFDPKKIKSDTIVDPFHMHQDHAEQETSNLISRHLQQQASSDLNLRFPHYDIENLHIRFKYDLRELNPLMVPFYRVTIEGYQPILIPAIRIPSAVPDLLERLPGHTVMDTALTMLPITFAVASLMPNVRSYGIAAAITALVSAVRGGTALHSSNQARFANLDRNKYNLACKTTSEDVQRVRLTTTPWRDTPNETADGHDPKMRV